MGGLVVNTDSMVCDAANQPIEGLYAAGEVAGGVHGTNRLGGNSLLDCVVFGRVSGRHAAKALLSQLQEEVSEEVDLRQISGQNDPKFNKPDNAPAAPAAAPAGPAAAPAPAAQGGALTLERVATHTTKEDCWVVLNGQVLDVTSFLGSHPGGELAILTFAGKDASEEFNMIHPPDVIGKYAAECVLGPLGSGGEVAVASAAAPVPAAAAPAAAAGYTLADVARHTTKEDCWVVLNGQVLDVTSFLGSHPGGELAILTFAGKDASEEFNMIHPPDVIGKYAAECVKGPLGGAAPAAAPAATPAAVAVAAAPAVASVAAAAGKPAEKNKKGREKRMDREGRIPGYCGALVYMALGFMKEILLTIFSQDNVVFVASGSDGRSGLLRAAMWLFVFIIIHAIGNLHVFLGPNDFNGYGYFYVRLYWTGFGLPANIVEIYVALAALLHVLVALKRTWETKLGSAPNTGGLNLIVSGLCLLTFMTIHLFQFRFGETRSFSLCPPPYLINFAGIVDTTHWLSLFWLSECPTDSTYVPVRDIYRLEFELFESLGWSLFYASSVIIFATHMCLGWKKCVTSAQLDIPKRYQSKAAHLGWIMTAFVSLLYLTFPLFAHVFQLQNGCSPTNSSEVDTYDWSGCIDGQ